MHAKGLDRFVEHNLLLGYIQAVLAIELFRDFLGSHRAEQAAARAALGRHLDRADLELFRRLARSLLLKRNAARMRLILRLFDVQVIRRGGLCQAARHEEVAAVALADLDQVAFFAFALDVGFQNYFHGSANSFLIDTN